LGSLLQKSASSQKNTGLNAWHLKKRSGFIRIKVLIPILLSL
jgi:hypothetical protein